MAFSGSQVTQHRGTAIRMRYTSFAGKTEQVIAPTPSIRTYTPGTAARSYNSGALSRTSSIDGSRIYDIDS